MSQHKHKLMRVVVTKVAVSMLIMSAGLFSPGVPLAYAIPCGVNCENITNTPSVSFTLNGSDQSSASTLTFSLNNLGALGWNVTITSTQFTTGSPVHTLATTSSSVTGVTAVCTPGQICATMPQNAVTYPFALPAGNPAPPVKLYDAQSASGVGTFDISTVIKIAVPANAYAGSYTSTITLAFVNGP